MGHLTERERAVVRKRARVSLDGGDERIPRHSHPFLGSEAEVANPVRHGGKQRGGMSEWCRHGLGMHRRHGVRSFVLFWVDSSRAGRRSSVHIVEQADPTNSRAHDGRWRRCGLQEVVHRFVETVVPGDHCRDSERPGVAVLTRVPANCRA